jgi:hypothetical protein
MLIKFIKLIIKFKIRTQAVRSGVTSKGIENKNLSWITGFIEGGGIFQYY